MLLPPFKVKVGAEYSLGVSQALAVVGGGCRAGVTLSQQTPEMDFRKPDPLDHLKEIGLVESDSWT